MVYGSARSFTRGTLIAIPNAEIGDEKISRISNNHNDASSSGSSNFAPGGV
jgi:hypothetical protein